MKDTKYYGTNKDGNKIEMSKDTFDKLNNGEDIKAATWFEGKVYKIEIIYRAKDFIGFETVIDIPVPKMYTKYEVEGLLESYRSFAWVNGSTFSGLQNWAKENL
tara:strand:- start:4691 stop:5002 length:312 start_codon:yes stop_codon:yes gene_type:complete